MKVTRKFYRRSASSRGHVFNDRPHSGDVYHEFEETWLRLGEMRQDGTVPKKRLRQVATSRRFTYRDRVSPELLEDSASERRRSKRMLTLTDPMDFTVLRLEECRGQFQR